MRLHCFQLVPKGLYFMYCNCWSFGLVRVQYTCYHYHPGQLIRQETPVRAITNGISSLQIAQNPGYTSADPQVASCDPQHPHVLSINVSHGAIHISNLDDKIRRADLQNLLSEEAKPHHIFFPMDNSTGKNMGMAIAYFATPSEAQRVLNKFNDHVARGTNLRIKYDKDAAPTKAGTYPIIINGSTGYTHQKASAWW
jgi:RNA recognition motif. (a.k.a. RRM, RBD, or RNP domain)